MRALTVRQPHASLIALGVKRIETRSWPTKQRGRIAIHAGKKRPPTFHHHNVNDDVPPWIDLVAMSSCWEWAEHDDFHHGGVYRWVGPLGAVVATANLVDSVPMVGHPLEMNGSTRGWVEHGRLTIVREGHRDPLDASDQLPYGDFTPGRWAWLLDDIEPTTERCPDCWGDGDNHSAIHSDHLPDDDFYTCDFCHGVGGCPPIPAKGHQGLWEWSP